MYSRLGAGWSCTILGVLLVLFAPAPFVLYWGGERLRRRSHYVPVAPKIIEEPKEADVKA
jgi:hypothetical protein